MADRARGDQLSALFTWRSAIADSTLRPTTRHVLLTLSLHMNERGGSCFPSTATLARETGLSRRSVETHLAKAIAAEYLARQPRPPRADCRFAGFKYWAITPGTRAKNVPTDRGNLGREPREPRDNNRANVVPTRTSNEDDTEGVVARVLAACNRIREKNGETPYRDLAGHHEKVAARLKDFTADELIAAFEAAADDDWVLENPARRLHPNHVFKNETNTEGYVEEARSNSGQPYLSEVHW